METEQIEAILARAFEMEKTASSEEVMKMIVEESRIPEPPLTGDFQHFVSHAKALFEGEARERVTRGIGAHDYEFREASFSYLVLLHKIYRCLDGPAFDSGEALKENYASLVRGKTIVDVGSGPGFALGILAALGANAFGVDPDKGLVQQGGGMVREGRVETLRETVPETCDVIISKDTFTAAILTQEEAQAGIFSCYECLRPGGSCLHSVNFVKISPALTLYSIAQRTDAEAFARIKADMLGKPLSQRERDMYANRLVPDAQDMIVAGFQVAEYVYENNELTAVLRKP